MFENNTPLYISEKKSQWKLGNITEIKKAQYITSYGIWLKQCSESNLLHKKAEKYELSVQLKKLQRE